MSGLNKTYNELINNIGFAIHQARVNTVRSVNQHLIIANWQIGKYIVEYEQGGNEKAEYGSSLLANISKDLKAKYGRGYSKSSIYLCRQFYLKFTNFQTVSGKSGEPELPSPKKSKFQTLSGKSQKNQTLSGKLLSWSHYAELLSVSDDLARSFYEKQALKENWSFREMKRQIDSALFQRLALSKDKKGVLALSKKGHAINTPEDSIKDPYIFEFLQLPGEAIIKESSLEKRLIDNLQKFLMELGRGFSFVARQYRITIDNIPYAIDLVFYHRILKCFVLIDLKTRKVKHQDIGQMNLYLNYFKEEENTDGDKDPIGIIIAADKNDLLVKYATGGLSNKIFVSQYQLYLPDQKVLEKKVKEILNEQ